MSLTGASRSPGSNENRAFDWQLSPDSTQVPNIIGGETPSAGATERDFGDLICVRRYLGSKNYVKRFTVKKKKPSFFTIKIHQNIWKLHQNPSPFSSPLSTLPSSSVLNLSWFSRSKIWQTVRCWRRQPRTHGWQPCRPHRSPNHPKCTIPSGLEVRLHVSRRV